MKNNNAAVKQIAPSDLKDVSVTLDTLTKIAACAHEVQCTIDTKKKELAAMEGHLLSLRKDYAALKPKVLGVLGPLESASA